MRNLKKILALALALIMSLSLVTTAGAFTDDGDINASYDDAITVLSGLDVFKGYSDGSFQPKGSITRAEVAAIIYRIVTGDVTDSQASIHSTWGEFTDVADGAWYAGYVNYCANAQYIKGRGNKIFDPQATVTGYEALAMILRAVGYDKNGEFTGSNWQVRTASIGRERGILKNVTEGLLGQAASRELVAEILFRSIVIPKVDFSANTLSYVEKANKDGKKQTIGYESFKLEEITGVITGNEYADLESGSVLADGRTRMVVDGADKTVYNLNYSTTLDDVGESKSAYIRNGNLSEVLLIGDSGKNVIYDNVDRTKEGKKISAADAAKEKGIKITDDTLYFENYDPSTKNDSDYRLRWEVTLNVPRTTADEVYTYLMWKHGNDCLGPNRAYVKTAPVVNADGTTSKVVLGNEIEPNTTINSVNEYWMNFVFRKGDRTSEGVLEYVNGEVFVGTSSLKDISDVLSWKEFTNQYFNKVEDKRGENTLGNRIIVIDNDDDGIVEYVLYTNYYITKVVNVDSDGKYILVNETNKDVIPFVEGTTFSTGDVVLCALIDGKIRAWQPETKNAKIEKVNRVDLKVTTTDGDEYADSKVEVRDAREIGLGDTVTDMAGSTNYTLYFDLYGNLAAFNEANEEFVLLVDGWFNRLKGGDEYAVKAWIDGKQQTVDITSGGSLFIDSEGGDNNSWNQLRVLDITNGALNGIPAVDKDGNAYGARNNVTTAVAMLSDGTLTPVDKAYRTLKDSRVIDMENNMLPGRNKAANGVIYSTNPAASPRTAYNEPAAGKVSVNALANTKYYFVYNVSTRYNYLDTAVREYVGYDNLPNTNWATYVENVYAVGSRASQATTTADYYTAEVVVVELNDNYYNHLGGEQVFIPQFPVVSNNVSWDDVVVIRENGQKEEVKIDLTNSDLKYYDIANSISSSKLPRAGLYYMWESSSNSGVYYIRNMDHDEIAASGRYYVGTIARGSYGSYEWGDTVSNYPVIDLWTHDGNTKPVMTGETGAAKIVEGTNATTFWKLSYNADYVASLDSLIKGEALRNRPLSENSNPADYCDSWWNEYTVNNQYEQLNEVLVAMKEGTDEAAYVISFNEYRDRGGDNHDYAQSVWSYCLPDTVTTGDVISNALRAAIAEAANAKEPAGLTNAKNVLGEYSPVNVYNGLTKAQQNLVDALKDAITAAEKRIAEGGNTPTPPTPAGLTVETDATAPAQVDVTIDSTVCTTAENEDGTRTITVAPVIGTNVKVVLKDGQNVKLDGTPSVKSVEAADMTDENAPKELTATAKDGKWEITVGKDVTNVLVNFVLDVKFEGQQGGTENNDPSTNPNPDVPGTDPGEEEKPVTGTPSDFEGNPWETSRRARAASDKGSYKNYYFVIDAEKNATPINVSSDNLQLVHADFITVDMAEKFHVPTAAWGEGKIVYYMTFTVTNIFSFSAAIIPQAPGQNPPADTTFEDTMQAAQEALDAEDKTVESLKAAFDAVAALDNDALNLTEEQAQAKADMMAALQEAIDALQPEPEEFTVTLNLTTEMSMTENNFKTVENGGTAEFAVKVDADGTDKVLEAAEVEGAVVEVKKTGNENSAPYTWTVTVSEVEADVTIALSVKAGGVKLKVSDPRITAGFGINGTDEAPKITSATEVITYIKVSVTDEKYSLGELKSLTGVTANSWSWDKDTGIITIKRGVSLNSEIAVDVDVVRPSDVYDVEVIGRNATWSPIDVTKGDALGSVTITTGAGFAPVTSLSDISALSINGSDVTATKGNYIDSIVDGVITFRSSVTVTGKVIITLSETKTVITLDSATKTADKVTIESVKVAGTEVSADKDGKFNIPQDTVISDIEITVAAKDSSKDVNVSKVMVKDSEGAATGVEQKFDKESAGTGKQLVKLTSGLKLTGRGAIEITAAEAERGNSIETVNVTVDNIGVITVDGVDTFNNTTMKWAVTTETDVEKIVAGWNSLTTVTDAQKALGNVTFANDGTVGSVDMSLNKTDAETASQWSARLVWVVVSDFNIAKAGVSDEIKLGYMVTGTNQVKILEDLTVPAPTKLDDSAETVVYSVGSSESLEIDLNGKTITLSGNGVEHVSGKASHLFRVENGAEKLTVKNGTINAMGRVSAVFAIKGSGKMDLDSITVDNKVSGNSWNDREGVIWANGSFCGTISVKGTTSRSVLNGGGQTVSLQGASGSGVTQASTDGTIKVENTDINGMVLVSDRATTPGSVELKNCTVNGGDFGARVSGGTLKLINSDVKATANGNFGCAVAFAKGGNPLTSGTLEVIGTCNLSGPNCQIGVAQLNADEYKFESFTDIGTWTVKNATSESAVSSNASTGDYTIKLKGTDGWVSDSVTLVEGNITHSS